MARSPAPAASAPIILICGDDDFTLKQRARSLYESWCAELGGMDHEIVDASALNSNEAIQKIDRLLEALNTLPFFGGAKVVWFQNCNFLGEDRTASSAAVVEALGELAEILKKFRWEGIRLIVSASKPDKRRAFYKNFEKLGAVESFAALSQDDKDWTAKAEAEALKFLRESNCKIRDDALSELVNRTGPNLRLLASETEKLILFTLGRPEITLDDVSRIISRQKHARAFALAESLGDRDLTKVLRILDEELWEIRAGVDKKKSEIGLLYGLITKVRTLILLQELIRLGHIKLVRDYNSFKSQLERVPVAGLPNDKRFNPLAYHPFVLFQSLRQTSNYKSEELVKAMATLLDANRNLVSSDLDEAMVLQRALIDIIGFQRQSQRPIKA
ncbi:MAG: DNA polymerase III subunit delta [Pedosphaera sp.]|nr:DNA polymerase III subunit delta [Pedosphaera sp.]